MTDTVEVSTARHGFRADFAAEVRLYLQLGGAFALLFLALDVVEDVIVPLFASGLAALSPLRLVSFWLAEGVTTFVVTYAFAAPVGAVLTLYLLTRPTHRVPRLLGVFTLVMIVIGATLA